MDYKSNKLIKDIEKKYTTIMIGALSRFEKNFSHLWTDDDYDDKEDYLRLWQQTRTDILNFGNHQARNAIEELYEYLIDQKRNDGKYYYEFKVNNKGANNNEN